jgi:tryptophan 7-halogenase
VHRALKRVSHQVALASSHTLCALQRVPERPGSMSMPDIPRACSGPIRKIVIAGGGPSGWMAAAAVSRMIAHGGISVTLIDADESGSFGLTDAMTPSIRTFNSLLELDEDDCIRHSQGTFKLGTEFVDAGSRRGRYLHPYGPYGRDLHGIQFHQCWLKLSQLGEPAARDLADHNLCTVAARLNRFMRPRGDPDTILSSMHYSLHLDLGLYAGYLRRYSESRGVRRITGEVGDVILSRENGFITGIVLQDGRAVEGELFLDCTGFSGRLIGQALGVKFQDWTRWLPCDRLAAAPCARVAAPLPYTRSTADIAGWRWRIPLQHRTGNGYVYCSQFMNDVTAQARLLCQLDADALPEIRLLKFNNGHRRSFWDRNCVAIGPAAGFIEPLESTGFHLIQAGISRLLALFPARSLSQVAISAYNRYMADQYRRIRDFVLLHYKASERSDTPFWRHCRDIAVPESLQERIELFRGNGTVLQDPADPFEPHSWIAVMLGQGITPAGYDPLVDSLPLDTLRRFVLHIREATASTAAAIPLHETFLDQTCAARVPSAAGGVSDSYC